MDPRNRTEVDWKCLNCGERSTTIQHWDDNDPVACRECGRVVVIPVLGVCSIPFAMVLGVAFLEWLMPNADILGHDLPFVERCCRCDEPARRLGLCTRHYVMAMNSTSRRGHGHG